MVTISFPDALVLGGPTPPALPMAAESLGDSMPGFFFSFQSCSQAKESPGFRVWEVSEVRGQVQEATRVLSCLWSESIRFGSSSPDYMDKRHPELLIIHLQVNFGNTIICEFRDSLSLIFRPSL